MDGGMPRSSHVHPARVGSDARRVIAVWALLSDSMMGSLSVGLLVGEERGDFVGGEAEAFLRGRKCRDKGGMVFAEVLRRVE